MHPLITTITSCSNTLYFYFNFSGATPVSGETICPRNYLATSLTHNLNTSNSVELQGFEPWTPALQRQCSSQLSYSPSSLGKVGLGGLEPPTSRLSGVRSNHLSYKPQLLGDRAWLAKEASGLLRCSAFLHCCSIGQIVCNELLMVVV